MEHKDTKNNLFLLTIVGIVAIVAIVILVASSGSRTYTSSEDSTGQAARATASADIATEGKTSTTTTTVKSYCIDSDGGKNYFIRGIVRYSDGRTNGSATDYCRSYNTSTLVEYYCSSGRVSQLNYACPYGCLNGACLNQTVAYCGDNVTNGYESCDGNDLGGMTCTDLGNFVGGTLTCYPPGSSQQCTFNTANCTLNYIGNLFVNSIPTNATIYIDNIFAGYTPNTIFGIQSGNHSLKLKKTGYYDYNTVVYIYAGQTTNITVTLTANQTTSTGNLFVATTPTGASLYVDNIYKGTTPRTVTNLTVGNHPIRISKTGYYDYTTTKYIYAGQTTNITVTLTQNVTASCTDTDGGVNYYTFGTVILTNESYSYNYTDSCNGNTTLNERYCSGTQLKTTIFSCPQGCSGGRCINQTTGNWTAWFDRDDGSGAGDYEQKVYFPSVCANPLGVECVTVSGGIPSSQTGQVTHCTASGGFYCLNSENNQTCLDYKVRWLC